MNTPAKTTSEQPAEPQKPGTQLALVSDQQAEHQAEQQAEHQAEQLEEAFSKNGDAKKAAELITVFITSYEQNKHTMPLDRWLVYQFKKYPEVWEGEAEIEQTAQDVINSVTTYNDNKASLYAHTDAGRSQASWLATKIEQGAQAAGGVEVGRYAGHIDAALERANTEMANTVYTQNGDISQAMNLDGFLAEQHHADTFNIDAAAKGSKLRAKVMTPENGTYGKNSMDIGIYDENGKLVKRYQAKYGKDADATKMLWDKGDYRGQRKLVPGDQVDQIERATDRLEYDGVESKPLDKADAKVLQEKAQLKREIREYQWNDANRVQIAKQLGKQAVVGACMVAAFQGSRIFGRRIWNSMWGKQNPPLSEDLREFFESSIRGAAHVGVQVAVSGGVLVAARNGWLGKVLKKTPAGHLATIAVVTLENAKILYKLSKGELTGPEAIDAMGKVTVSTLASLQGAAWGFTYGTAIGTVLGPLGAAVGGLVGGVVGGMAGSAVGELLYEGRKRIAKEAIGVVKSLTTAGSAAVNRLAKNAENFVNSIFSW